MSIVCQMYIILNLKQLSTTVPHIQTFWQIHPVRIHLQILLLSDTKLSDIKLCLKLLILARSEVLASCELFSGYLLKIAEM